MKYDIPEKPAFFRDGHSKALLMHDPSVLQQEKARLERRQKTQSLEARINKLEETQTEILSILRTMNARY